MKKILFGLISVSMISFAAQPVISGDATKDTPVFQTGQTGKIPVKGSLSSKPLEVKYVVYASVNGEYNATDGEYWTIPTIVIEGSTSPTGVGPNGSTDVTSIPKIYVKRVNGDNNGVVDLDAGEIAEFKLQIPSDYEGATAEGIATYMSSGVTTAFSPFIFFSKAALERIMGEVGTSNTKVFTDNGGAWISVFEKNQSGGYSGGFYFNLRAENSVFYINDIVPYGLRNSTYLADAKKIDNYFAIERPASPELAVLVNIRSK